MIVLLLFFLLGAVLGFGFRVVWVLVLSALVLGAVFVVLLVQSRGFISASVDALLAVAALQAGYAVSAIGRGVAPEGTRWSVWYHQQRTRCANQRKPTTYGLGPIRPGPRRPPKDPGTIGRHNSAACSALSDATLWLLVICLNLIGNGVK